MERATWALLGSVIGFGGAAAVYVGTAAEQPAVAEVAQLRLQNAELTEAVKRAQTVAPSTSPATPTAAAKRENFPTLIEGHVLADEVDQKLFRACSLIENDQDARNMFLFAQNALFEARKAFPEPWSSGLKPAGNYMGRVDSDGDRVAIRLRGWDARTGESGVGSWIRVGEEMQAAEDTRNQAPPAPKGLGWSKDRAKRQFTPAYEWVVENERQLPDRPGAIRLQLYHERSQVALVFIGQPNDFEHALITFPLQSRRMGEADLSAFSAALAVLSTLAPWSDERIGPWLDRQKPHLSGGAINPGPSLSEQGNTLNARIISPQAAPHVQFELQTSSSDQ